MEPRIEILPEKKLAGQQLEMTFNQDKTFQLWRNFMPRRKEITNQIGDQLFAIQVYGPGMSFETFHPEEPFVKWATVEVSDFDSIPEGMEPLYPPRRTICRFSPKRLLGRCRENLPIHFWNLATGIGICCRSTAPFRNTGRKI
jgi:predicted transcriptional regulator YdeE